MNKKTLSSVLQEQHDFNQNLFKKSIELVQSTKPIVPIKQVPLEIHKSNPTLKKKHQQLEASLAKTIKLFGQIIGTEKNTLLGGVKDYGQQIFEELTDLIETGCQSFVKNKRNHLNSTKQAASKNQSSKTEGAFVKKNEKSNIRPQDQYPNTIHPFENFSRQDREPLNLELLSMQIPSKPALSSPITEPLNYVNNLESFKKMISELSCQDAIAVDLEHSNKSYEGLTCLIQISTREKDFIIDVFPIWEQVGLLSEVISNPRIVKVMHGAEMDVKWLQRDFDIHIKGLFDTYKASRVLGFPKFSYAYLLNHYCNVLTDKKYQLADWRERPLSKEMIHYARLDTHYLLEIWDRLRISISEQSQRLNIDPQQAIKDVYSSSHQVTMNEVELFSYKKKEIYQDIKNDMRPRDFEHIEAVFWVIDQQAKLLDEAFDDLIPRRSLLDILSRVKDMIQAAAQKSNKAGSADIMRTKIDRLLGVLKSNSQHPKIGAVIVELKSALEQRFIKSEDSKSFVSHEGAERKREDKERSCLLEEISNRKANPNLRIFNSETFVFKKPELKVFQPEYSTQTYGLHRHQKENNAGSQKDAFSMVCFEPVMQFLSTKFQISQRNQEDVESAIDQEESQSQRIDPEEQQAQEQEGVGNQEGNEQGFLEFKRIKPNVIYTIEQEGEEQKPKNIPKKKRKELEYETKLKNKEGNIYDLLEENC